MKVLIIDDREDVVEGIVDHISKKEGWDCKLVNFCDYKETIAEYEADIVILDLKNDADDEAGNPIFDEILDKKFRPIIVFSAIVDTTELERKENPLIKFIKKGDEQPVIDLINKWYPYVNSIKEMRDEMNKALIASSIIIEEFLSMPETPNESVVKYMLNKRANRFFDNEIAGEKPPAWIQYEFPPMLPHLVVADVLKSIPVPSESSTIGDPCEYFIVLTPSCDLASRKGTNEILVACGEKKSEFCSNIKLEENENLSSSKGKKKVNEMAKKLNLGYNFAKIAIPELPNKIPCLTFDLKKLRLIKYSEIALNEKEIEQQNSKYVRVASISSPFREQVVWAHMINSCRPGTPERDTTLWAQQILT